MLSIEVSGLVVRRGGRVVLDHLDLAVPAGTVTGLLGPNGSGKSTLLRAIVGAQRITAGTVRVLGRPAGHPALRAEVGYTTQAPSVYGDLTAAENVRYHAAVHRIRSAELTTTVRATLHAVGLAEQADRLVRAMSGGQVNRVSLACALVGRPRLLLLDEPTVGLDPLLRRDLWLLLRAQVAERGATLVVSSHVLDEAAHCDRLLLLRAGRLIAQDTPQALLTDTGATTMDDAFLRLVEAAAEGEPAEEAEAGGTAAGVAR